MFESGLVSITFRQLSYQEVIKLCTKANLSGIEWGGDLHAPSGDVETAKAIALATAKAGLKTFCYGSYYRLGNNNKPRHDFGATLATAEALGAPVIRIWAGTTGSAEVSAAERKAIVSEAHLIADMAAELNIRVAFEYHAGTLTDSEESAAQLMEECAHPNITTLWQPINKASQETCLSSLRTALPKLEHVHIFQWDFPDGKLDRRPLSEGEATWLPYLEEIKKAGKSGPVLMEFVRNDSSEQLLEDADTLNQWLTKLNG